MFRRPFLGQDPQDVLVRVAVVDLQCLAGALGQIDVPAKRVLLGRSAFGASPEIVQSCLANHPDSRVGGEQLDLAAGGLELASIGQPGCFVGVQRHAT